MILHTPTHLSCHQDKESVGRIYKCGQNRVRDRMGILLIDPESAMHGTNQNHAHIWGTHQDKRSTGKTLLKSFVCSG